MNEQIQGGNIPRNSHPRTPRRFLYHESIVIEPQSRADVPVAAMPVVLHVGRGLEVPPAIRKLKRCLRSRIELRWIGDRILQRLVYRAENAVHARLPVVLTAMSYEVPANVAFAIAAVLRDEDRRREWIRCQRRAGAAHAAGKIQKQTGRNRMLEKDLPGGLPVRNILTLERLLLHQLIGDQEAHCIMDHRDAQPVAIRKIPLIGSGKAARVSTIREILEHRRIQVAIRMKTVAACGKTILPRAVGKRRRPGYGGKTSAPRVELAVNPPGSIFGGGHLDDAAELSSI